MNKKKEILSDFIELVDNIKQYKEDRKKALDIMFWEYNNINIHDFEDSITKFRRHFPDRRAYPSAFLASSLGFNKSNFSNKHNEFLQKFKLYKKPRVATLKNGLHFEKLKIILIKYMELMKKQFSIVLK